MAGQADVQKDVQTAAQPKPLGGICAAKLGAFPCLPRAQNNPAAIAFAAFAAFAALALGRFRSCRPPG